MGELIAALFSVQWGTLTLVEILWTVGALVGMLVSFWKIRRAYRRRQALRDRANPVLAGYVNRDILFRHALLGLVLEVAMFLGLWSMLEPQSPGVTSSAAIAGLAFWLVEIAIIAVVLHEEVTYWRVQRWYLRADVHD